MKHVRSLSFYLLAATAVCVLAPVAAEAQASASLRQAIEDAVGRIKPSLVRIHVVEAYYGEGREMKYELSGSGAVITPEGHVITNHHVAGHAKQIKCVFADKSEYPAELIGTDPLTDIAVIKLISEGDVSFPVAPFGNSDLVRAGDHVLAMGSPLALSQSVTLGIVSNTEMIMPEWMNRWGGLEQDGEDVGALVRWLGHDAEIYGGNSGGPLVNITGEIIGINEIRMGLGGAIPGNLAKSVAEEIIASGKVKRAWLGLELQPRLKHGENSRGVLVSGALKGSPAEAAGLKAGDILLSLGGAPMDVRFLEQLPDVNRIIAELPIGEPVPILVERDGQALALMITPTEREPREPQEHELKQWGLTVRDLSLMLAQELKRDSRDGVLVTSVRPGGPAGDAKPAISEKDVIVGVGGKPVHNLAELLQITQELTKDATEPVPVLTEVERKTEKIVTVVKVGIQELEDPGLEVKKAWLPVETQVLSRDIAELMGRPDLTGFRVTHVYKGTTAEAAGLQVGDVITAIDEERMTASAPEHYEELAAWIRQYKVGTVAQVHVLRGAEEATIPVELIRSPKLAREMKKFRDENFEFTVRDVTFFDKAKERWEEEQKGVLVEEVKSGGWAALGLLGVSDLVLGVDGVPVADVAAFEETMKQIAEKRPAVVVFQVMRGIHTFYIEMEPKWDGAHAKG